jgi:hypothetical protein
MARALYSCFTLNDELDLLHARLLWEGEHVDHIVIAEATRTLSGRPKPLHLAQNRARFAHWEEKLRVITVDDLPVDPSNRWPAEVHQRNALMRGLKDARPDDIVIVCDVDELIDRPVLDRLRQGIHGITALEMESTFHRANWMVPRTWRLPRAIPAAKLSNPHVQRNHTIPDAAIPRAGLHFSYLLDAPGIQEKFATYAHREMDDARGHSPAFIERALRNGLDLFFRRLVRVRAVEELLPLQRHLLELYPALFDFTRLPPMRERRLLRGYAHWRASSSDLQLVRLLDEHYDERPVAIMRRALLGYAWHAWWTARLRDGSVKRPGVTQPSTRRGRPVPLLDDQR